VGTSIGCICSALVFSVVILYALLKGKIMLLRGKPLIATVIEFDGRTHEDKVTFGDLNMALAFTVIAKPSDSGKFVPLNDPEWVTWWTSIKYYDETGKKSRMNLTHHDCNETDW
jgi:hypothetical protein